MTSAPDFDRFVSVCADPMGSVEPTHASRVEQGIAIYDGPTLAAATGEAADELKVELAAVLGEGGGVVVIEQAWADHGVVDAMTDALLAIVERERADKDGFDHFGAKGANSRAWDVLSKSALHDPEAYVAYYGNPALQLVCEAWLGPWYQLTAQVNIVHPGGAAQSPHRDYHLGFLSDDDAARFPQHVHDFSSRLTLQGAVAHTPMPIESGPTMVLPGSHRFGAGYRAWRDERFKDYFAEHFVQLPLSVGDAVFFCPALHHGAGENRTADHDRIGNLLQISSAFGIPMEAVDWWAITAATYPELLRVAESGTVTEAQIAACATGYAFPSNLDTDPSTNGLAPSSAQDLLRDALGATLDPAEFCAQLAAMRARRLPFGV